MIQYLMSQVLHCTHCFTLHLAQKFAHFLKKAGFKEAITRG